ncbi:winged helix-turn-helix transcriptional regulator [Kibdelosporangium aridum]|uniref:Transcriptional regulator, HxlR family n=1 Tax=Kibdelosporangium aridum TaxID=2030 RepID=A0A1Y5X7J4_KIBAR|nr:helix-turn-helix domain-containing protein [Kibdelosporangium aridum]SMC73007.1 transcriptional regulator, HxlR family [Kibdelosporangium aridum]
MKRSSLARWPCSIARTMDLLGDWWTPLVLRESFYGIRRFDEFQRTLGIARNTLTERLTRLVAEGLLEKQMYQEKPLRYEYVLTEKGRDFFAVLLAMTRWGDRWLSGMDGPPVTMHHDTCGHEAQAEVVCSACGEHLTSDDVTMRFGPGYPERLKKVPEVRRRFAGQGG